MKILDLQPGIGFHVRSNDSNFLKEQKKIFNLLRMTWWDPCCSTGATETPVRFNVTGNTLERVVPATGLWTEATVSNVMSVTTGITAHASGGQGSAVALTSEYNNVTTSATVGDSVKLPTAAVGTVTIVKNSGATAIDVFPFLGDTINGGSANAAVRVAPGSTVEFTAINATDNKANNVIIGAGDGAVGAPAFTFATQPNMGLYKISSTQLGASVSGALVGGFNASGLFTGAISEQTGAAGVTFTGKIITDKGIVTQGTNKTTTVILNKSAGVITTVALTDAADTSFVFTLTNSLIVASSVITFGVLNSGNGIANVSLVSIGSGTCVIRVANTGTAAFNSAIAIHFTVS